MSNEKNLRDRIIGLGEHSFKKSYFPELQSKINELNLFKIAFDKASEMYLFCDLSNGRVMYWNDAAKLFFSNSGNAETVSGIISEKYWNKLLKQIVLQKTNEDGGAFNYKHFNNGKSSYLKTYISIVTDQAEEYGVLLIQDETDRISREEKIRESEERFRTIVENTNDALFIFDFDGKILDFNTKSLDISGYSAGELLKHPIMDILSVGNVEKDFLQLASSENMIVEGGLTTKKLHRLDVSISSSIFSGKGKGKIQCFVRDISYQKKVERELLAAKLEAEESDRLKSAFLANMSHEIRTPMNGIVGFASLLQEEDLGWEDRKQYTELIVKGSNDLLRIINDVLDISKLESGQVRLFKRKFEVNEFLYNLNMLYLTRMESIKEGVKLVCENAVEKPTLEIFTDELRLKQILINLIDNSLKFTEKGEVRFGVELHNGFITFFVEDTGIGIPKNKQEIIFDRFRQSDDSISRKYGGTGLGLSISLGLIELMDGEIRLESEEGKGSKFYVTLPME
jgi:PAS domain S-box-containing protein